MPTCVRSSATAHAGTHEVARSEHHAPVLLPMKPELFAVSLMHATFNIGWQFFPPSGGLLVPSFYDPRNLALTAFTLAGIVTVFWGAKTLVRYGSTVSDDVRSAAAVRADGGPVVR